MNTDDGDLRRLFPPTMTLEQEKEFMKKAIEVPEQLISMAEEVLGEKDQVIVPKGHVLRGAMKKWKKQLAKRRKEKR
jgi:hypothetical protein